MRKIQNFIPVELLLLLAMIGAITLSFVTIHGLSDAPMFNIKNGTYAEYRVTWDYLGTGEVHQKYTFQWIVTNIEGTRATVDLKNGNSTNTMIIDISTRDYWFYGDQGKTIYWINTEEGQPKDVRMLTTVGNVTKKTSIQIEGIGNRGAYEVVYQQPYNLDGENVTAKVIALYDTETGFMLKTDLNAVSSKSSVSQELQLMRTNIIEAPTQVGYTPQIDPIYIVLAAILSVVVVITIIKIRKTRPLPFSKKR